MCALIFRRYYPGTFKTVGSQLHRYIEFIVAFLVYRAARHKQNEVYFKSAYDRMLTSRSSRSLRSLGQSKAALLPAP